jgi:hypothetical protein
MVTRQLNGHPYIQISLVVPICHFSERQSVVANEYWGFRLLNWHWDCVKGDFLVALTECAVRGLLGCVVVEEAIILDFHFIVISRCHGGCRQQSSLRFTLWLDLY